MKKTPIMKELGRILIVLGIFLVTIGSVLHFSGRIPWLGRLPGDIIIRKQNFTFYFPIVTCLLLSAVLTFLFYVINKK